MAHLSLIWETHQHQSTTLLPDDTDTHPWQSENIKWNQVPWSISSFTNWNDFGTMGKDLPLWDFEKPPHCLPGSALSNPCFLKAPQALQSSIMTIDWTTDETQLTSKSTTSFPMFQSNNTIWVRWGGKDTRTWKGPYMVILSTPMAVKIAGILPWTHHTQVKKAEAADAAKWSVSG